MRRIIEQLQSSPKTLPGRALVIGFSMGGGIALTYAAGMPDLVSAIVAYYPKTMHILDMNSFVGRIQASDPCFGRGKRSLHGLLSD